MRRACGPSESVPAERKLVPKSGRVPRSIYACIVVIALTTITPLWFNVRHSASELLSPSLNNKLELPTLESSKANGASEGNEVDDILADLLDIHHQEQAEALRMVPAQDLPSVVVDGALVATLADGGYAACAVRLIESVRGAGLVMSTRPLSQDTGQTISQAVGLTAWFLLKPSCLPDPQEVRRLLDALLERWRPAFRFNDQGLWNLFFYRSVALFPKCFSGPLAQAEGAGFAPLLHGGLSDLGRAIEASCGPRRARRQPVYTHGLKDCLPQSTWDRKKREIGALPRSVLDDLVAKA